MFLGHDSWLGRVSSICVLTSLSNSFGQLLPFNLKAVNPKPEDGGLSKLCFLFGPQFSAAHI